MGYATKDQMPLPIMQEKVFPLAKGQISEPIPLPGGTYGVFQVMDEVPVSLERVRSIVETELHREKAGLRSMELGRELLKVLNLRPREDGFEFLATRLESEGHAFSEVERGTVLYEFDGGTITVGEFVDSAKRTTGNSREMCWRRCAGLRSPS